jgi:CBS domain-containing protein
LKSEPKDARSEFWIAIAGPAMSFALAAFGYLMAGFLDSVGISDPVVVLFAYLGIANLVLAIFNLVPAFPMDGGRVLRAFLWYLKSDLEYATRIASRLGSALGVGFMALGLFSVLNGAGVGGFWLILIGFFVLGSSRSAYESQMADRILHGHTVGQIMTRAPATVPPWATINELVQDVMLKKNVGFIPVVNGTELLGYIDRKILHGVDRNAWDRLTVGDVYAPLSSENSVAENFGVTALVERMQTGGQRKFLVVHEKQLRGVISLSDIVSYISLEKEFGHTGQ